jgi:uncharacterized protein
MNAMWLYFPILGIFVGVMAGLLGIGGGLVLVSALVLVLPNFGVPQTELMHVALATSLASIVLTASASTWMHHRREAVLWKTVAWFAPGLLVGGVLGTQAGLGIPGAMLKWGVAIYCGLMALQMWTQWPAPRNETANAPEGAKQTLMASVIGAVSSWVGIGGGSMTVPWLVWQGISPVRAVATSSACGVLIGLSTAFTYALNQPAQDLGDGFFGYVLWPAALGVGLTSIFAARWGVALAHRLPAQQLRGVFAVFLLLMGLGLLFSH